ncbi:MAG: L-threonylcarbamoyladenylate synthase [Treponema sp.]|jgi:tRNA threonylcarbamoyl adenosine modification protein (Sua5/YciO/YrdC/YwlC family)|nr:L-threonylcarbamoyladenylate synthase [Treponema sp.]
MIEYIVPGNIDDRILSKTAGLLQKGGTVALPTDTSWSVVCSINSKEGIKRLRALSKERDERHFTLLCSDISQFGDFCSLDNTRFRLIKRLAPGPYVFILKTLLGTEKILGLRRSEIGVRLPDYSVPLALIGALGCPLYGITAKRNMITDDFDDFDFYREETLFDGGWELEEIRGLDLILDPGEDRNRIFSTVLDLSSGEVQVLRQGAGHWPV